jgi:solute carrier family 10 (sodium/bile acid cotransporter), member 7
MKQFLLKRWFLLLMIGGITIAGLIPHQLRPVTDLVDVRVVVALALFLMAWSLESRSLWETLLRPWPVLWATVISFGLLPILGWMAGSFLIIEDFRIGLMISVSVPCTLASAVLWTRMARGNEATALWTTLSTTGLSWIVTTAWLAWGTGTQVQVETKALMQGLFLVLVLPVVLGQLIRGIPVLAQFANRRKTRLSYVSQFLILIIVWKAAVDIFAMLESGRTTVTPGAMIIVAVFCLSIHLIGLTAGFWTSRLLGFNRPNQIGVAFACSQKSLPVALFLYESYFQAYPLAVMPLAFYHVGQLMADTLIADRMAKESRPVLANHEDF